MLGSREHMLKDSMFGSLLDFSFNIWVFLSQGMDYTSDNIGTFSSGPQFLTIAVAIA